MKKKRSRIQQRQRQKMSRRTVVVIAASCMTCMVIGLTIFFNMSRVDKSMADNHNGTVTMYTVTDEEPVIVKTLEAPVVKQMPVIGSTTQLVRSVKVDRNAQQNNHN